MNGVRRGLGWRNHGLRRKVEGNAENIRVFHIEEAFVVDVVGLPAKGAADDLLAEELCAEGADSENMGDGIRIPPLGEHRDGHNAADFLAERIGLPDGVHHLAE